MKLIDVLNSIEDYTRVNVMVWDSTENEYHVLFSGNVDTLPFKTVYPNIDRKVVKIGGGYDGEVMITVK